MDMITFKMKGAYAVTVSLLFILLSSLPIHAQNTPGERNTLNVWNAVDVALIKSIQTEDYIWQAVLNSDGTIIAALHNDGTLATYEVQSGAVLHTRTFMTAGDAPYTNIRSGVMPGQLFVLQNEQFWLWDFVADEILLEGAAGEPLEDMVASPDGQRFLAITRQDLIIFDTGSGDALASIDTLPRIWDARWSPDSRRIAVAHEAGFNVFDSETGATLLDVQDDRVLDVYSQAAWSPDGATLLALASPSLHHEATEIAVIDSETLQQRFSIPFDQGVFALDWNSDSSRVLTASYNAAGVSAYNAGTGDLIRSYRGDAPTAGFLSAGWNYDDTLIVGQGVAGTGNVYAVWEAETGRLVHGEVFADSLMHMVWNAPKTRVLFAVWPRSMVDLLDLTQPDVPRYTLIHKDRLQGEAWSADGSRILTWTGQDMG